jgi:hypothetical protein
MKMRRLWTVTLVGSTVLTGAGLSGTALASTASGGTASGGTASTWTAAASTASAGTAAGRAAAIGTAVGARAQAWPASGRRLVAAWNMNERAGSTVMRDDSGNGLNGRIGAEVGVAQVGGARGYRFDRLEPDTPPTHPRHLVVVPDSSLLNPGTDDFGVTLRLRTDYQFGNIIQKGQATVGGGSWKLQIPSGHVQCWFRGSAGSVLVTAPHQINDGRWHVVRCDRTEEGVSVAVDGVRVAGRYGATGRIANDWPLSIGGKTDCDQRVVGCDYYAGDIDYVAIDR